MGALIAIAIILFSFFVVASGTERFIFTRNLEVGEFSQIAPDSGRFSANVSDSGIKFASITVDVYLSGNYATMFMEAPQMGWPKTEFHRSDDSTGIIFSVDDLVSYGIGTLTREFILVQNAPYYYAVNNLRFFLGFSMHQKSFLQLTSLMVQTFVDITIPN